MSPLGTHSLAHEISGMAQKKTKGELVPNQYRGGGHFVGRAHWTGPSYIEIQATVC